MENNQGGTMMAVEKSRVIGFTVIVIIFLLGMEACVYRKSAPLKEPLAVEGESVKNGQIHFMHHCQKCHPQGEGGLGPAINHVPGFAKRFQIRHGLGVMPAFKKEQISKKDLQDILAYLKILKENG